MNRRNENQGQSRGGNGNNDRQPERYPQQEWSDDDYRGGNRYRVDRPYASDDDDSRSMRYGDYESERELSQPGSYYGGQRSDEGNEGFYRQQRGGWSGQSQMGGGNYGGSQAGYSSQQGGGGSSRGSQQGGSSYGQGGSSSQGGNYGGRGQRSYGSEYGAGSQGGQGGYQSQDDRVGGQGFGGGGGGIGGGGSYGGGSGYGGSQGGREFGQGYGSSQGYGGQGNPRYGSEFSQSSGGYQRADYGHDARDFSQSGGYGSGYSQVGGRNAQSQMSQRGHSGKGPKGYTRSDDRLKEDINERLTDDYAIDAGDISVEVSNGTVTLTGTVDERWMKHHIEDVVDRCSGVQDIQNRVTVKSRSSSSSASSSTSSTSSTTSATSTPSGSSSTSTRKQ